MSMSNNVMKMRQLKDGLEIKPGQTVELKPGGYHLMLTGLHDGLKQGQKLTGMLRFEKAGTGQIEFAIAPIGAQSGGHMQHARHRSRATATRPHLSAGSPIAK